MALAIKFIILVTLIELVYQVNSFVSPNHLPRNQKLNKVPKSKVRAARKINVVRKDNSVFDLGNDIVAYNDGGNYVEFKDVESNNDLLITMSNVYERLVSKISSLHLRVAAVEDKADAISHRLEYLDCYDYKYDNPTAISGIYGFHLDAKGKSFIEVMCDMITEGGGWTVIQQRLPKNINDTIHTNFIRNYREYKIGFGSPDNDYWLGLENIYLLTNSRQYELRIVLTDFNGQEAHAHYKKFYLESEEQGYRLHVAGYSGNAGDSLSTDKSFDNFTANGMMFSTYDHDRDTSVEVNCAAFWNIGGWWYNRCSWANLNGPYNIPQEDNDCVGINWHKWRNKKCLQSVTMMIRPLRQT